MSLQNGNEKKSILSPEMRAIDAINPQSVNFKEAREAGITTCASGPGSLNVIGGQYACIKTPVSRRWGT